MGLSNTSALTRRRLGGAVLLLAAVVIAIVVLWPGGDGKPAAATPKRLPARIVSVPPLGMGFLHPTTWTRSVSKGVIRLRSPDGSVSMFLSSPVAGSHIGVVKGAIQKTLLKQFAPAKIVATADEPLGQRQVASFELFGKDRGKPIHALEMVDATQFRTYAVTVVTAEHPSGKYLNEGRKIIATVTFSKPTATTVKPTTTATTTTATTG
jgi:hypothetical protein